MGRQTSSSLFPDALHSDYSQRRTTVAAYVPVGYEPTALVADMFTATFVVPTDSGFGVVWPAANTVAPVVPYDAVNVETPAVAGDESNAVGAFTVTE